MMLSRVASRSLFLTALAIAAVSPRLTAQAKEPGPRIAPELMPVAPLPTRDLSAPADTQPTQHHYQPTYWVEGGVMSAVGFATVVGGFAYGFCDSDSGCHDRTAAAILGGLGAGAIGFGVGALIGGAFPASHPRPLKGHPLKGLLVGTAAGALTTFGLVSQGCLDGCSSEEVGYDFLFTVVMGMTGTLLGLGHASPASP